LIVKILITTAIITQTSCHQTTHYNHKYRAHYNIPEPTPKGKQRAEHHAPIQYTPQGYAIIPLASLIPHYTTPNTNGDIEVFTPNYLQLVQQDKLKPATTTKKTHRVTSGETLSKIAQRYYYDKKQYVKIIKANPNLQKNPNLLKPGMTLIIP